MALKNINEINTDNYSKIDQDFTTYTLGSLANMGQRLSANGSSISQTYFTIRDIFPSITDNVSYIKCNIIDDKINVYINGNNTSEPNTSINRDYSSGDDIELKYNYSPIDNEFWYEYTDSNTTDVIFADDLNSDVIIQSSYSYCICDIKDIDNNSKLIIPSIYYKTLKYTYPDNQSNSDANDILIYKYELTGSKYLLSYYKTSSTAEGFKLNQYNDISFTSKNIHYNLKYNKTNNAIIGLVDDNGNIIDNYLSSEITNSSEFDGLNKVISIYNKEYNNNIKVNILKTLLYSLYESYNKELEYYNTSAISTQSEPLEVYFDTNYRFTFYCDSVEQTKLYHNVNDIIVKECVNLGNNDITDYIKANSNHIICDWSKAFGEKSGDNVYDIYDKYVLYNIDINRNTDNIIETVISDYYTLPYINKYNHWVINNTESKISASGLNHNTGFIVINSNNVITHNSSTDDEANRMNPVCLSKMYADDINNLIRFTSYQIQVKDYGNYKNQQNTKLVYCALPDINNITDTRVNLDAIEFIKSSVIMVISEFASDLVIDDNTGNNVDSSKIIDVNNNIYYTVSYWVWDNGKNKFTVLEDENNHNIFDLYTLSNLYNIIEASIKSFKETPGQYLHKQLIFEQVLAGLKHENDFSVYPGIQNISYVDCEVDSVINNKTSNKYGTKLLNSDNIDSNINKEYKNTANLTIGFWNKLTKAQNEGDGKYQNGSLNYDIEQGKSNTGLLFDKTGKLPKIVNNTYADINGSTIPLNDYIPDILNAEQEYIPFLDTSSVLIRHVNAINRNNILSISKDREVYYSYIGTDFTDSTSKSILKIGSYNINADLSEHVVHHTNNGKFKTQNTLQLDFPNLNISAKNINLTGSDTVNLNYNNLALHGSSIDLSDNGSLQSIINSQLVYRGNNTNNNLYIVPLYPVIVKGCADILQTSTLPVKPTYWLNKVTGMITSYLFILKNYISSLNLPKSIEFNYNYNSIDYSTITPPSADVISFEGYNILQPIRLLCSVQHIAKTASSNPKTVYHIKNVMFGFNNKNYI